MFLHLTRDSVAAGDDVAAPHSLQMEVSDHLPIPDLLQRVLARPYLAAIAGGRATWSVISKGPIAVVAQQWPTARLLPAVVPDDLAFTDNTLHLHFRYHQQLDPDAVYEQFASK